MIDDDKWCRILDRPCPAGCDGYGERCERPSGDDVLRCIQTASQSLYTAIDTLKRYSDERTDEALQAVIKITTLAGENLAIAIAAARKNGDKRLIKMTRKLHRQAQSFELL